MRAHHRMKAQANKNYTKSQFTVNDRVYLKLQSYIQTSIATRGHQKLSFRYYEPYELKVIVGEVAYELILLPKGVVSAKKGHQIS